MKLSEISDPETYVYIKVVAALSHKFKVGDYIKTFSLSHYDENEKYMEKARWVGEATYIGGFRSKIDSNKDIHIKAPVVKQVTMVADGYIEAKTLQIEGHSGYHSDEPDNLTGYNLREEVEEYVNNQDYEETDAQETVDFFVNSYIQLDEDYADSIIMESDYAPYSNSIEIKSQLLQVEALRLAEDKELLRRARVRGWDTRRRNQARIARQVQEAEQALARVLALKAKKKATKKVVKKVIKKAIKKR